MPKKKIKSKKIAILIPAYNEEETIGEVVQKSKQYGEVIVLDDGSSDATRKISMNKGAIVFSHRENYGIGTARKSLYAIVNKKKSRIQNLCIPEDIDKLSKIPEFEVIINLDADGELKPRFIPKIVKPILEGNKDLVVGIRNFNEYPLYKKVGNIFLSKILGILFGVHVRDSQCGLKAMTPSLADKIKLSSPNYGIEAEILLEASELGAKIGEIDIIVGIYRGSSFLGNFSLEKDRGTKIWNGLRIIGFLLRKKIDLILNRTQMPKRNQYTLD